MPVPSNATSILLAIDVSGSMCSTDVAPNRLTAAQEAAREFVQAQDDGTRIGLVAFSGIAGLLVEPTTDKDALLAAIDTLRTARGTAIGLAILASVDAIAEINPDVPPTGVELPATPARDAAGDYQPDTIVVLTDGRNTQGVDPVDRRRAGRGPPPARLHHRLRHHRAVADGVHPRPDQRRRRVPRRRVAVRRRFGGGGGRYQQIDEDDADRGRRDDRRRVLPGRGRRGAQPTCCATCRARSCCSSEDVEITVWFVLAGALLVLVAVGLAQWWNRLGPVPTPPPGGVGAPPTGAGSSP